MSEHVQFKSVFATLVVLIGGALVLVSFFQPWVETSLLVKNLQYSGIKLANKSIAIWLVPLFSVLAAIFMAQFLAKKQMRYRILAMIFSLLGVIFVILIFIQISREIATWIAKVTQFQYRLGIMGVLCGFLIQLIGTLAGNFKTPLAESPAKKN
jgi:hypothetical protein